MRRRCDLPPRGGISFGSGEILISIVEPHDVDSFCEAFGERDGFSKELRAAAAAVFTEERA